MGGLFVIPARKSQHCAVGLEIDNAIRKLRERNMKKITGILAGIVVLALGLFLLFNDSAGKNNSVIEPVPSKGKDLSDKLLMKYKSTSKPTVSDDSSTTEDKSEQLSQEKQDMLMDELIIDFWEELGLSDDASLEEKRLSLDIFNRPYMKTINESEYRQLSPEDQEKTMAEVGDTVRKTRSFVLDVLAQAKSYVNNNDYVQAEAYFLYVWEVGREFTTNKEGLHITRLIGYSCEKNALNELVKIYDHFGEHSKVQTAKGRLSELEGEFEEIKRKEQQYYSK